MPGDPSGHRGDGPFQGGSSQQSVSDQKKDCVRFKRDCSNPDRDFKDAVAYLTLRGSGCPRKEAITCTAKDNCRIDTTKESYGPKNFRKLKILKTPPYLIEKGWLYGSPDYDLGKCFPKRNTASIIDTMKDQVLEDNFNNEEIKVRREYLEMISRMKAYVDEVNSKYSLAGCRGTDLIQAARRLVNMMKQELEQRSYMVVNSIKFYHIAELVLARSSKKSSPFVNISVGGEANLAENIEESLLDQSSTLIDKLNVFRNFENDPDFKDQSIHKDEDDVIDRAEELLLLHDRKNSILIHHKGVGTSSGLASPAAFKDSSRSSSIYAQGLRSLESAKNLLEEFEKNDDEDIPKPIGRFVDRKLLEARKQRSEQMRNSLLKLRLKGDSSTQNGKTSAIEDQFNGRMYLYNKDEKSNDNNLMKDQAEKQQLFEVLLNLLHHPKQSRTSTEYQFQQPQQIDSEKIRALKTAQDNCINTFMSRISRSSHRKNTTQHQLASILASPSIVAASSLTSLKLPMRTTGSSLSRRNFLSASTIATLGNSPSTANLRYEKPSTADSRGIFSRQNIKEMAKVDEIPSTTKKKLTRFSPNVSTDFLHDYLTVRTSKNTTTNAYPKPSLSMSTSTTKAHDSTNATIMQNTPIQQQSTMLINHNKVPEFLQRKVSMNSTSMRTLKTTLSAINLFSSTSSSLSTPKDHL